MRFGMHLTFSVAPARAKEIGCKAVQVFCGNPRGWQKKPLDPQFVKEFRASATEHGIDPVVVHATYLINLAARDEKFFALSKESFVTEIARAAQLGAKFYVVHIGNHMGAGLEAGRKRVAECMQAAVKAVPEGPDILVENTAGGGTTLGTTFEEIALLFDECKTDRLGLCLDTCHALAAGYDIRTPAGVTETLDNIDRTLGIKRLRCLHINDSKGELRSHLDRHEHIGKGQIGDAGFRALFADKRIWGLPAILETPRDEPDSEPNDLWHAIELAIAAGAVNAADVGTRPEGTSPGKARAPKKPAAVIESKPEKAKLLAKQKDKGKMKAAAKKPGKSRK
jgi:deoxyribonuclease IV